MTWIKAVFVLLFFLLPASSVNANSGMQPWPEGWSEVMTVGPTGIYGQRTAVAWHGDNAIIASIDGRHAAGLSLVVRGWNGENMAWQTIVTEGTRPDAPVLLFSANGLELFWVEQSDQRYHLQRSVVAPHGEVTPPEELRTSDTLMQDLHGVSDGNRTYLAWVDRSMGQHDIFVAEVDPTGLGDIMHISEVGLSTTDAKPVLGVWQGGIHVAWVRNDGVDTVLAHRSWDGQRWSEVQEVATISSGGDESVAFLEDGETLSLLWASLMQGAHSGIFQAHWDGELASFSSPEFIHSGSRMRAHSCSQPALVWQVPGPQGFTVQFGRWSNGDLFDIQTLNVRSQTALRPEILQDSAENFHVFWIEAHAGGGHQLMTINTAKPRPPSILRSMGVDDQNPWFHVGFALVGSFMLSMVYIALNVLVLLINVLLQVWLRRWSWLASMPTAYWVVFTALTSLVLFDTPLAFGRLDFSGFTQVLVSATTASFMLCAFLGRLRVRNDFESVVIPLLWLFWYQMLMLFPQALLMA